MSSNLKLSQITDTLFIGRTPKAGDFATLRDLGVDLVINMRIWPRPKPDPHDPPMPILWLRTFDSPIFPIPIEALEKGTKEALEVIKKGGNIYAHCQFGRHRGAAMGAAILIAQGHTADEAMALIKEKRPNADPYIWYIKSRILKFADSWNNSSG
ncbi:MAG: dual specificity protein phosphatase family protein [Chloroflexi bacterium]|nr:dual specificity protein phosphatase family protein [Chloroflexota bacterium]